MFTSEVRRPAQNPSYSNMASDEPKDQQIGGGKTGPQRMQLRWIHRMPPFPPPPPAHPEADRPGIAQTVGLPVKQSPLATKRSINMLNFVHG